MDGLKNLTNWAKKFGSGVTRAAREGRKAAQAYDENDVRRFRSLLQEQYPDISETLDLLDSPISGKLTRALLAFRDKPELLHPESPQRIDPGLLGELVEKKTGATFPEVVAALRTQYNKKLTKAEKRAALAETSVSPTARRTETMELLLTDSMKEYLAENGLEVGPGATDTPDDTVEYIPASTTGSFGTELEKAIYRDDNERVDVEDTRRTPFNSLEQVRKLLGADILTKTDGTLINRPVNKDKRYTLTAVLRSDEEGITPQIIGRMLGGKESRSKGYDAKGKSLGFDGRPMGINEDTIAMRTTEDGGYRQEFNTIDIAAQAGTPQERGGSRENFEGFVSEFENIHRDLNIQGYRLLSAIASLQSEGIDIPRAEVPQDVVESLVAGTVDKVVGENATAEQRADALNKAVEQWRKGDNIQLKVELPQDSLSEDTIVQKKGSRAVTLGDLLGANRGARSLQAQYTLMTELGENPSGKLDLIQKGKEPLRELAKARAPGHDEFMAVLTNDEAFAAMSEEEQQAALDKREKRHAALVKEKARQIKLTADALRKGLWGFSAEREANQGNDLKESRGAALATILNKYAPAYVEELNYRITNAESKQRATYNLQQLKEGYREGMFTADDIKDYIVALGPPTPNERTEDAQLEFDPAVIESIDEFLVKEWADQLKLDYTGGGDLLNILEEFDNGWLMTELDQQNRFENPDPTTSEPTQDEIFNAAMKTSPEGTETRLNKRGIDKQNDAQVRAEMEAAAHGTLRRAKGKVADRETITITTVNGDKLKRPIAAEFTLFGETFVIHKAVDGKGWAVTHKDTARGIGVSGHKSISAAAEAGLARLRDVGRANVKRVAAENRRPTATERQAEVNAAVAESEQERLQRRRAEMKAAREAAMSQKSVVSTKRKAAQDPIQKETNKDSNIKSRVDTIEKMLNSGEENPHHTTADPTMRNLIEMFRKGVFTASMGERQISRPFDPAIMEEAVDIYERNMAYWRAKKAANLKDWDPDPPEVKALYVHTDGVRELYTNTVERYLEEEDATPQVDPAKVTDGQAFPQANFEWTTKKAGEEYENYNLCRTCADRTARMLRKAGLPAATAHIGQKDFSGKTNKIGDHTVALTRINGVEYIVDQPQREMFAPASPPRANVGVIQSPEFTPRFIENTLENVKALYGADRVAALAGNVEFEAPISSPATQQEAVAQPQETRQQRIERIQRERKAAQTKQSVVKTKRETPQPEAKGVLTKREGETNKEFIQRMKAQQQQEQPAEAAAQQQPTPPPPPPPEEPPGGTPDNPVPPPPPPPDNEAQARFRATVKRLMGDRVDVAFDQDLPEGVAAEYQNRWGMDLENTAKALDAIYERRRELLREIKKTEAVLNDPNNKTPFDELPDVTAMRAQVAELEKEAEAYRADLAIRGTIRVAAGMEDQAGLAEHESFHAAFEIFFGEDNANDRKVVTTAFTRGVLANRLQKYFAGNEEVLAVIDPTSPTFSAEEAAAYAFQVYLHEPGALQMGEKVEGIFNRFLRYLQKLVGYQTYEDRAKTIFNDLNSGRRSERGVSVLRDQPGMEKSMLNRSQDFVKAVGTGFMHMYDTVLSSSYSRLADSGNVAMAQIARLGYNETGERGQGMIQLQRLATTQWSNRLKTSLHALTAEELSQLNQAMVMNEELSGKLGEAQKRLRTLLNDVREYQTEAGVEMGFIEDYYPLVWNPDKVAADPQAFLKMLNNYPTEIAEMMKTPEEILDSILSWEDRGGEFQGVFGRDGEPVADSSRRRSLAFITAADRAKYVEDDLVTTMAHYINQSVRHAEYVRAYGQNGERLRQLMGEITGTYGGSQADVDLAKDYIDGLMGNKEVGMSRELKDLYGAATVYQNVRLLPLSVFSSLVDPLGVAVRTNSLGAAFDTFTYSIKNLFTDFRSKTNWTPDQWEQYADDMGTIDMSGTVKSIDKIYTGVTLRGKTREINDGFFKWNLLNGWVKNNHIMATKAAQLFLRRSAEGMFGEEMSAENLREVGVKPEDIMYDEALGRIRSTAPEILGYENAEQMEQQADPDDVQAAREQAQRIQQAIHKIVRQSMIQPSSAEMPSWMSNPYLAPIAHLKTFVFGFNATILNRLVYEAQRGNYNPIYYAAGYIPGMMAADFVKGLAGNGGEEPEWKKNWGLTDYVGYGVDRSGLTGTAQFFTDMNNDITRGGGGWEALAGPTIEQAHDLMAAMNGKTSEPTKTWMLNAMPVNDLYDQWVMP